MAAGTDNTRIMPQKETERHFSESDDNFGCRMRISSASHRLPHSFPSAIVGVRFPLGRHFTIFVTYTWSRVIPTDKRALSSSCPDGPTNGPPYSSSTPPGPSPTIIKGASTGPVDSTGPRPPSSQRGQSRHRWMAFSNIP